MATLDSAAMKDRTKDFALRVIKMVRSLPRDAAAQTLGQQVLRSGTSVAANYRAACRARSRAEFAAKLGIIEEEADESCLWFELLGESGVIKPSRLAELHAEAEQLVAITVASIRTSRSRKPR